MQLLNWIKKNQIDSLAILAGVIMLTRTVLITVPAPFPLMASTGDLLWNASLAYGGAWTFNKLVVERPRKRNQRKVWATSAKSVADIANVVQLLARAAFKANDQEMPEEFSYRKLDGVLRPLKFSDPNPFISVAVGPGGKDLRPAAWAVAIRQVVRDVDDAVARLQPVYSYYDAELIDKIEHITRNGIFSIVHSGHLDKWIYDNPDLHIFHTYIGELWWAGIDLQTYYDEHIADHVRSYNMQGRFPGLDLNKMN